MPRWPRVAILMRPMQKARLPSRAFRTFRPEFAKFFKECHRLPCVWQASLGPTRTSATFTRVSSSFSRWAEFCPTGTTSSPFKHSVLAEWRCYSAAAWFKAKGQRQDGQPWPSWCIRCIKRAYRQEDSEDCSKNLPTFSKNAIGCHVFGRHPMLANGGQMKGPPQPQKPGKLVSWTPENSDFVRGFVQSRKDQPVLLRSRAICRLSRIFSEIL